MLVQNSMSKTQGCHFNTVQKHVCPECKSIMSEVDRVTEHGVSFIWYECTQEGCNGQWLEKTTSKMEVA